ncbi:MAG TPA: NAD(+)/NADH kinase [Candidatus Polarisedimenticolia bacterium]|jgi:NAD+ kinase
MPSPSRRKNPNRINRIGFVIKRQPARARQILPPLVRWLRQRGVSCALDQQTAEMVELPGEAGRGLDRPALAAYSDLIIVIGGDGTLLSVAREMGSSRTPILGVNLGSLGFLTEIPLAGLQSAIEGILLGRHKLRSRMRLRVEMIRGEQSVVASHDALNDVVVNKSALARILDINVEVNGRFMTTFKADGLIVATPSGSTAYSLSAGGPIVDPSVDAVILCPICPHTLTNRPVVAPGRSLVEVGLEENHGDVYVTIDGQIGSPFLHGDRIRIRKSSNPVRLIQFPEKDYFEVLRQKLKWGGRVPRPAGSALPADRSRRR